MHTKQFGCPVVVCRGPAALQADIVSILHGSEAGGRALPMGETCRD